MSQLVSGICWNPEEVDTDASGGMDLQEQASKEQKLPSSMPFILAARRRQFKADFSHLKDLD